MTDSEYFNTFSEEERKKAMTIKAMIDCFGIAEMDHQYTAHIGYSEKEIERLIAAYDWIRKDTNTKD